ncbi:MAG: M15 family metallopeptidase [Candidatus Dormibacteraceae bacterium]
MLQAQELLPPRHRFVIFDAYRSLGMQQSLYNYYLKSLRKSRPDLTPEELSMETQKYVRLPSKDSTRPAPHNTGGSVDLVIVKLSSEDEARIQEIDQQLSECPYETDWSLFSRPVENPYAEPDGASKKAYVLEMERILIMREEGEMLDFGTPFDWGGSEAALRYYEEKKSLDPEGSECRDNRRLLHNALTVVGFTGYPYEWWHFNASESQMGARVLGLPQARFGGQRLGKAHLDFEDMRRRHHVGMIEKFDRVFSGKPHIPSDHRHHRPDLAWAQELNLQALQKMLERNAPPVNTRLPRAAVIAVAA